jgi:hypothetical protein
MQQQSILPRSPQMPIAGTRAVSASSPLFPTLDHCLFDLASPLQEAKQMALLPPEETNHFRRGDLIGLHPGIGLDPPSDVVTPPGPQTMASRSTPNKSRW